MKRALLSTTCVWLALSAAACSSNEPSDGSPGGSSGAGGSPLGGSGGLGSVGGRTGSTGGNATGAEGGGAGMATTGGGAGVATTGGGAGMAAGGSQSGAPNAQGGSPAGGSDPGGMGGGAGSGASGAGGTPAAGTGNVPVEPAFVTSAQNAFWKEGTLTEVTAGTAEVTVNETAMGLWDGFGGTFNEVGWDMLSLLTESERNRAMTLLFGLDGARFAFGRIPIGASDYATDRYTLNETANDYTMAMFSIERDQQRLIPYIQAALALNPSIRLWASPWTPPTWMKDNNAFDGGNMKDDDQVLEAHALYLAKFVEEYAKLGITIEAIHPQNEPGYETRYPSCLWTPALMNKYIRDFLGPLFESRSVPADIYLGTMSNADAGKDGTIISTVIADSATMAFVKGFGLQWNMIDSIPSLKSRNLPIVQSEHKCGNYPWETATFNPDTAPNDYAYGVESWGLIVDWITAGATSYSAWNMVLDKDGKNLDPMRPWPQNALLTVDKAAKTLTLTPAYYVFRHVSQFVDPGATRLGTTGGDALAFKNPDGSYVAVLYNSGGAKKSIVALGGKKVEVDLPQNGFATVNLK